MSYRMLMLTLSFWFCTLGMPVQAAPTPDVLHQAIDKVYPALIRLDVVQVRSHEGRLQKRRVFGSGVIIDNEGHVVTNHHVAGGATRIVCRMVDGEELEAILLGTDALSDIAVVRLDLSQRPATDPLPVAAFGNSDSLQVGDMVFAMGSPAALSQSVTRGIISNTAMILPEAFSRGRRFDVDGEAVGSLVRWIGHDAVLFGGNSGGPLVNAQGKIIGINEMGIGSLGGAIPGNLARYVVEQLIQNGEVPRSWMGVEGQPRLAQSEVTQGVLVGAVYENSPAALAGIEPGDVIISYDHVMVDCAMEEDVPVFNALVLGTPVGKAVPLELRRGDQTLTVTVVTVARGLKQSPSQESKVWGMALRDLTHLSAREHGAAVNEGVLVDSVASGGAGGMAKPAIEKNDIIQAINNIPVTDITSLRAVTRSLLESVSAPLSVTVSFQRKGQGLLAVTEIGTVSDRAPARFPRKAWLPVESQVVTREIIEALALSIPSGVRLTRVFAGHAAEQAGLRVGDILVALEGQPIRASDVQDTEVLATMVRQYRIGTEVSLSVLREGTSLTLSVPLEARPALVAEQRRYQDTAFEFTLRGLAFIDRLDLQLPEDLEGVLVESVQDAGWAALAGLEPRDVVLTLDQSPVTSIKAVRTVLKRLAQEKKPTVVFFVRRDHRTLFIEVETNWTE